MSVYYRQCLMRRGHQRKQTSWIPEEFAKVGKVLRLKKQNGWEVLTVSDRRMSGEYLSAFERQYFGSIA